MKISIKEIEESIKKVLENTDILNSESVYEKIKNDNEKLKLVIFFNKIFGEKQATLYTKLIFIVDNDKINLEDDYFLYLSDIDCKYDNVNFDDIEDFENKLKNIFEQNKFGVNSKILSKFIENPTFLINDWLKLHKIKDFGVTNIKYNPKKYIMPCKSLIFPFIIEVNDFNIELTISKEDDFIYTFDFGNGNIKINKKDLSTLVETIGDALKNNIK